MRWMGCCVAALALACTGGDDEDPPPVNNALQFNEPIHTVEITATTGQVTVSASPGSDVLVFSEPDADDDDWQHSIIDGKLVMGSICGDGTIGCGSSFDVEMPPNTDLNVFTTSGPVELAGLGGRIDVDSDSGTIFAEGMQAADLVTKTVDAGTQLGFDMPPRELDVLGGGSGSIVVTVPPGNYQLDIETIGSVTIEGGVVDGDIGPELILESGTGSVRVSGQ